MDVQFKTVLELDPAQLKELALNEDLQNIMESFKERLEICRKKHNYWNDVFSKTQEHLDKTRIKMYRVREKFEKLKDKEFKVLVEYGKTICREELQELWEKVSYLGENREIGMLHLWSDFSEASNALLALFRHLITNQSMLNNALHGLDINVNLLTQLQVEFPDYEWADNNFCESQFCFSDRIAEINQEFEEHSEIFDGLINFARQ